MNYSDIFKKQWDTFCNDFSIDVRKRRDAGLDAGKLDEWYQLNILRWESSIETEGVVLEQQNNKALRDNLLRKLKNFKFEDIPVLTNQKGVGRGYVLIAGAVVLSILGNIMLPISRMWRIIFTVVIVAIAVMEALKGIQSAKEKENVRRREKYKEQLVVLGDELTALCRTCDNTK